ncbi:unnamed protein product, partial [Onchocerca ochengi]
VEISKIREFEKGGDGLARTVFVEMRNRKCLAKPIACYRSQQHNGRRWKRGEE